MADRQATPLEKAVERYASVTADINKIRRLGLEELPHQKIAFKDAAKAVEALRPDGSRDLWIALNNSPELIDEAAKGRTAAAIRAMTLEAEIRVEISQRADRFVTDWQSNIRQLKAAERGDHYEVADRIRGNIQNMARKLERDPQLESLLRNRSKELGIERLTRARLSHDLQDIPALSRGRGLEM